MQSKESPGGAKPASECARRVKEREASLTYNSPLQGGDTGGVLSATLAQPVMVALGSSALFVMGPKLIDVSSKCGAGNGSQFTSFSSIVQD